MSNEIDYTLLGQEVARASLTVHDDTADAIEREIPEHLKNHVSGLFNVPPRGSIPQEQRLQKAQEIQARTQRAVAREAEEKTRREAQQVSESRNREESDARRKLGIPIHGVTNTLPDNWREWVKWIEDGNGTAGDFQATMRKEKENAKALERKAAGLNPAAATPRRIGIF